jgi:hypothetical protein
MTPAEAPCISGYGCYKADVPLSASTNSFHPELAAKVLLTNEDTTQFGSLLVESGTNENFAPLQ